MRKLTIYSLAFTIALAAVGCTKELEITEPAGRIDQGGELIFFASNENDDINAQTKTVLGNNGLTVTFVKEDKIKIYDETINGVYEAGEVENGFMKFTGSGCSTTADTYYAVYPSSAAGGYSAGNLTATIPAEQSAPLNSFDPNANVSVAKGDKIETGKYNLKFKNVGNLFKFHFDEDSEVTAIIIKSNDSTPLTGKVKIDPSTGVYDSDNIEKGSNLLTLKPVGSSTFKSGNYYAVALPNTYAAGVSVKLEHSMGSYHFKRGSVKNQALERNKVYQLFSGGSDLDKYTEAAVLPSLYKQSGTAYAGETYQDLNDVSRISFHAMAVDADWNYANAHNQLHIMGDSDVRGYVDGGTLHIWTKKGMFAIPEYDLQSGTTADGSQMFNGYKNVTAIDNLSYVDVTFLHSFKSMFYNCNQLKTIDLSSWDTSSATTMSMMFNTGSTNLKDVVLGEWFTFCTASNTSMFGTSALADANKIRVSCPDEVYNQFNDAGKLFSDQVKWNAEAAMTGGNHVENFGEFLNPTILVTSVDKVVNFTFTLGGYFDNSALTEIEVGLEGYTPAPEVASQFTAKVPATETIGGVTYNMYTMSLSDQQKRDRRVVTKLLTQSTAMLETHAILRATNFPDAVTTSRIYAQAFSGRVKWDDTETHPNFISGFSENDYKDYTEKNWPIVGQKCNVTFYLQVDNGMTVNEVWLSNGIEAVLCSAGGSGAPSGYTAYTTNSPILVSNKNEVKELEVDVRVESQKMLHSAGTVSVPVYGIKLEDGITSTSPGLSNSQVYVLKCYGTDSYLCTGQVGATNRNNNTASVYAYEQIDNFSFWRFNSDRKLETYNTSITRYYNSGNVNNIASNGKAFTLENGTNGLKFKNGSSYLRFTNTLTNKTVPLSTGSGNNEWIVYPVTFTKP